MTICSHTLVKNGMPFLSPVINQVLPYVDRCLITISEMADNSTKEVVDRFRDSPKVTVFIENVKSPSELTHERQKQLDMTLEDWVWFLDDDDFYPEKSIEDMLTLIDKNEDVDAYSLRPFQIIDKDNYDLSWNNKWFTKFFKKQNGVHYRGGWPRDLIYKGNEILYWKKNKRVVNVDIPFFHLSYIKNGSFRNQDWAKAYGHVVGKSAPMPEQYKNYMEYLYGYIK